jgi:hypothetical protein
MSKGFDQGKDEVAKICRYFATLAVTALIARSMIGWESRVKDEC